jgi:hypothetical protein
MFLISRAWNVNIAIFDAYKKILHLFKALKAVTGYLKFKERE